MCIGNTCVFTCIAYPLFHFNELYGLNCVFLKLINQKTGRLIDYTEWRYMYISRQSLMHLNINEHMCLQSKLSDTKCAMFSLV